MADLVVRKPYDKIDTLIILFYPVKGFQSYLFFCSNHNFNIRRLHTRYISPTMFIPNPVQILCFGNSLTQGFPSNHPYAIALEDTFQGSSPYISISTDVQGVPGDQVVSPPGHYLPRLDILCKS